MDEGVPPPPDEERCRRRGTPNWRCPERALPGKSHCLKHYLFYVSRRHRLKTVSAAETTSSAASAVEPYRPVIDFDFRAPPVQTAGSGFNDQTALVGAELMGRFGEVDLWNGEVASLSEPGFGGNDNLALGGQIGGGQVFDGLELRGKFEGGVNFLDGVVNSRKRGRPKGSKSKKKGEESGDVKMRMNVGRIDHHDQSVNSRKRGPPKASKSKKEGEESGDVKMRMNVGRIDHYDDVDEIGHKRRQNLSSITTTIRITPSVDSAFVGSGDKQQNLSWVMRDKQSSDSENDDERFDDPRVNLYDKELDEGLWCNNSGELPLPTTRNGTSMTKKKRGRPKGSKNKQKIFSNGGEVYDITTPSVDPAWFGRSSQ